MHGNFIPSIQLRYSFHPQLHSAREYADMSALARGSRDVILLYRSWMLLPWVSNLVWNLLIMVFVILVIRPVNSRLNTPMRFITWCSASEWFVHLPTWYGDLAQIAQRSIRLNLESLAGSSMHWTSVNFSGMFLASRICETQMLISHEIWTETISYFSLVTHSNSLLTQLHSILFPNRPRKWRWHKLCTSCVISYAWMCFSTSQYQLYHLQFVSKTCLGHVQTSWRNPNPSHSILIGIQFQMSYYFTIFKK